MCQSDDFIDKYGTTFEDKDFKVLKKGKSDLETYSVPETTVKIVSGTSSNNAFGGCINLRTITFPQGSQLESIGSYAFYYLKNLKEISVKNCTKLRIIGSYCFYYCTNLQNFEVSNSIASIEMYAFGNTGLTSFIYPINTLVAKYCSFQSCHQLISLTFPSECIISTMEAESFPSMGISTVTIPASVTNLENAFTLSELRSVHVHPNNKKFWSDGKAVYTKDNTTLVLVVKYCGDYKIPDTIVKLGKMAMRAIQPVSFQFNNNISTITYFCFSSTNFTSIICPSCVNSLGIDAFSFNSKLEYIKFDGPIIELPNMVLKSCPVLHTVILPSTLKSIGSQVFRGCTSLKELTIPKSVDTILSGAFEGVVSNINITLEEGSPIFLDGDYMYNAQKTLLIAYIGLDGASISMLESTLEIGVATFKERQLKSVEFPLNLKNISGQAFMNSKIGTKKVLLTNVENIGEEAFASCDITEIELGSKLKTIGKKSFADTKIASVKIPKSVVCIESQAFLNTNLLTSIELEPKSSLSIIEESAFQRSSIKSFDFFTELSQIGISSFANSGIKQLSFNSEGNLKKISAKSFANCLSLTSISFGNIEEIGENAFEGCTGLTHVVISKSICSISPRAFRACDNLEIVEVAQNSNLIELSSLAFESCIKLRIFDIPKENKNFLIEEGIVYNYVQTKIIVFPPGLNKSLFNVPSGITEIGAYACLCCSYLREVILSETVQIIGFEAFRGSKSLERIVLNELLNDVYTDAFKDCTAMTCDSVVFAKASQKSLFTDLTGINPEVLEHCPSKIFTANIGNDGLNSITMICCALSEMQETEGE